MYFQSTPDAFYYKGRDIPPNERYFDGISPRRKRRGEMKRSIDDAEVSDAHPAGGAPAKLAKVTFFYLLEKNRSFFFIRLKKIIFD